MALVLLLVLPLLGGVVVAVAPRHPLAQWTAVATNGATLALGIAVTVRVVGSVALTGAWGVLRADALSAFMVVVIGVVALLTSWLGIRTVAFERRDGRSTRGRATGYGILVQIFVATMLLAVLASNLGVLWVAVEATTIVTTFLVGHRRTKGALEASWKYLVICSVGIALAFLGTVFVYLAALHAGGHSAGALDWTSLMARARGLDPSVMRLAFALLVLGYGTKVGLAPMHSWLPDAHSQAPAPVSALMSGVLLTVAFYAILRFKAVVDLAVGPAFPRTLLVIVGLLSLAVAASLLIAQRDYKRMLAYSSIEHMGLIALGAAAGIRLAIAAVLLQILGHGLTKTVLFLTSGEILAAEGTSQIDGVRTLLARRPVLGGVFGIGLVALLGLPPFSLFSSELLMTRAEFQVGLGWVAVVAVGLMVVIFVAVVGHARRMLLGGEVSDTPVPGPPRWVTAPLVGGLAICAFIGVAAWPLDGLLQAAAKVVAP
ncbi:MAG: proton-conducting transporter membrane subunit [Acidimicrobiales bacterium]|jgi:hydrogenase-4 component F